MEKQLTHEELVELLEHIGEGKSITIYNDGSLQINMGSTIQIKKRDEQQ